MNDYNQPDDDVPTLDDPSGDANVRISASYETAVAAQDDAESHYAALCCTAEADSRLDAMTRQEIDAWCARTELLEMYRRHGRSAMNAVVRDVDLAILAEHQAETARLAQRVLDVLA